MTRVRARAAHLVVDVVAWSALVLQLVVVLQGGRVAVGTVRAGITLLLGFVALHAWLDRGLRPVPRQCASLVSEEWNSDTSATAD
jgi:hypothetical protein